VRLQARTSRLLRLRYQGGYAVAVVAALVTVSFWAASAGGDAFALRLAIGLIGGWALGGILAWKWRTSAARVVLTTRADQRETQRSWRHDLMVAGVTTFGLAAVSALVAVVRALVND
jgi:hypothetical protein